MADENIVKVEIEKTVLDELQKLPAIVSGLVEEVKGEKQKRQEAEKATADALAKAQEALNKAEGTPPADSVDPAEAVRKAFEARDLEDAKKARESAEAKFKNSHREFHPDNDPGGLKYAAFERELGGLNLTGLKTEADFEGVFGKALKLMGKTDKPEEQTLTPYDSDPDNSGGAPRNQNPNTVSAKEKKLYESLGWTEERYLKQKKSRPEFVADLLARLK